MKEATGEANMTVITVILISVVAAVATPLIRNMMTRAGKSACCAEAGGTWTGTQCDGLTTSMDAIYQECTKDSKDVK